MQSLISLQAAKHTHVRAYTTITFEYLWLKKRQPNYNVDEMRESIQEKLRGPACMGGYRSMWHALRIGGHQVPRSVVEQLMRELDPEGIQIRRSRRLRRRIYRVQGPNHCGIPMVTTS